MVKEKLPEVGMSKHYSAYFVTVPSQMERNLTSDLSLTASHVQFQNSWTALAERSDSGSGCKKCSFLANFFAVKAVTKVHKSWGLSCAQNIAAQMDF